MSFFRIGGFALFSSVLLSGCVPPNMVNGGLVNPWVSPYPAPAPAPVPAPVSYVDVYKYQGSRQCEGGGVPLAEMQRQLQSMRIPVVSSACGMDGRVHAGPDGWSGRDTLVELARRYEHADADGNRHRRHHDDDRPQQATQKIQHEA